MKMEMKINKSISFYSVSAPCTPCTALHLCLKYGVWYEVFLRVKKRHYINICLEVKHNHNKQSNGKKGDPRHPLPREEVPLALGWGLYSIIFFLCLALVFQFQGTREG
jgi:hypothetical protein